MSNFVKGDRVVNHGDNRTWKGKHGRIRHVDNGIGFALVVPDEGLPPGFDVRWSTIDIHPEKGNNAHRAKPAAKREKTVAQCQHCGTLITLRDGTWQHAKMVDCFEGAQP